MYSTAGTRSCPHIGSVLGVNCDFHHQQLSVCQLFQVTSCACFVIGLTNEEIDIAVRQSSSTSLPAHSPAPHSVAPPGRPPQYDVVPHHPPPTPWRSYLFRGVVFGGVVWIIVRLVKVSGNLITVFTSCNMFWRMLSLAWYVARYTGSQLLHGSSIEQQLS